MLIIEPQRARLICREEQLGATSVDDNDDVMLMMVMGSVLGSEYPLLMYVQGLARGLQLIRASYVKIAST